MPMKEQTANETIQKLDVFVLAGVGTWPHFFKDFVDALQKQFEWANMDANIHVLFPYGDVKRNMMLQLREIRRDLIPVLTKVRYGGVRVAAAIRSVSRQVPIVFIGHSAGGLASYHAGIELERKGYAVRNIIQIGSPKHAIQSDFRHRVCFTYAQNAFGKCADPITRIGSWGGWERGIVPMWNRSKYAPASVIALPIIGWHADYFRNGRAFIDEHGQSNLDKVVSMVMNHFQ